MLVAQNGDQLIDAIEARNRLMIAHQKTKFVCPHCRRPVIFKCGRYRIPHFSHVQVSECPFSENESEWHLAGKARLKEDVRDLGHQVRLEHYFSGINQRADLYVPDCQTVIEYQCSPISFEEIKRRTDGYLTVTRRVVWILGKRYDTTHYSREMIAKFATFRPQIGFYFICFSGRTPCFCLHYGIREIAGRLVGERQQFTSLKALFNFLHHEVPFRKILKAPAYQVKEKLLRQLRQIQQANVHSNKTYRQSVNDCYQFGKVFVGCPMVCHAGLCVGYPIFRRSILCWRVWLVLRLFSKRDVIRTHSELGALFTQSLEKFGMACAQVATLQTFYRQEFRRFLVQLHDSGYLQYTINGVKVVRLPEWFTDYDQKRRFVVTVAKLL